MLESDCLRWPAASECCERLSLCTSFFALNCSSRASNEYVGNFSEIKDFKGLVIWREAVNSSEERFDRSLPPIPPNLAGSAKRFRSASLGGGFGRRIKIIH